jgi:hypothetical protein
LKIEVLTRNYPKNWGKIRVSEIEECNSVSQIENWEIE